MNRAPHNPYIQTTHNTTGVYTLDLNAFDNVSTTVVDLSWSCVNTFIPGGYTWSLGNTRVSSYTSHERLSNNVYVYLTI